MKVEADQFIESQTGSNNSSMIALSRTASASSAGMSKKLVELIDVERAGQTPGGLGRADSRAGLVATMRSRTR